MTQTLLDVFSAVLGAIIGSFLNACIHRLPRNISLNNPKRSFCPSCGRTLPWHENLPIVSWLLLRGRCAGCGTRIPARYFIVEVITAGLFFLLWRQYGIPLVIAYWIFAALLIAATFIDIEHFIIPDEITWGGTAAGVLLCGLLPGLMLTPSRWEAMGQSLLGAALGFGILWSIVELGKIAFGRKRHTLKPAEPFLWKRDGEDATLTVGEEKLEWQEIFSREKDELILNCDTAQIGETPTATPHLRFRYNVLIADGKEMPLDQLDTISGTVHSLVIPREAMGFGDVKFIAAIGAFLGWKAVLFTVCAASIIGCVAALGGLFLARDKAGTRLPFGPFLALGAALWLFIGQMAWDWYFGLMGDRGLEF